MTDIDKAWLESANLKELEDEVEELTDEIIVIGHQLDMVKEFPHTKSAVWKHKAKMAKACKTADRDKVRRRIRQVKAEAMDSLNETRNRLLINRLREEIGEDAFQEIAEECKEMREWMR